MASSRYDDDGYRPNVGIILCNVRRQLLWARRSRHDGWQFPQGGIEPDESVEQAVYRELYEEIGLRPPDVCLVGRTRDWLHYDLPKHLVRDYRHSGFRGQKQLWFLFHLLGDDSRVCLDTASNPEFDNWRWVEYWSPVRNIVHFKRTVYRRALTELEPMLHAYVRHTLP